MFVVLQENIFFVVGLSERLPFPCSGRTIFPVHVGGMELSLYLPDGPCIWMFLVRILVLDRWLQ
jgi:hypothetical protein